MDEQRILNAVEAVAGAVSVLSGEVAGLGKRLNDLDNRFNALDSKVTSFRVDLMARLDRHENALTGIRGDIAVNMHRADRVHNHSENTRSELRDLDLQVGAMERQQRHQAERITALENGRASPPT